MVQRRPDVIAVGHAIVDVLAPAGDDLVAGLGLAKGTMTLIDLGRARLIYDAIGPATEVSGGSAANTAVGLASLGASAEFVGKVSDDLLGEVFTHDIRAAGVDFLVPPAAGGPGTGRCMVMVTGDAEKTMCTYLGIGDLLGPEDIDEEVIAAAGVLYLEGYLCGLATTDGTVEKAVSAARVAGTLVSLSLSDPLWVELHGDALEALLDRVDILFGNEQEACGIAGADRLGDAVTSLSRRCPTVVVTRGAAGSVVAADGTTIEVPAGPVDRVVDTTGAGDLFAAGYLYGVVKGFPPERCARLGGLAAAEVIGHIGARPAAPLAALEVASL